MRQSSSSSSHWSPPPPPPGTGGQAQLYKSGDTCLLQREADGNLTPVSTNVKPAAYWQNKEQFPLRTTWNNYLFYIIHTEEALLNHANLIFHEPFNCVPLWYMTHTSLMQQTSQVIPCQIHSTGSKVVLRNNKSLEPETPAAHFSSGNMANWTA